MRRVMLLVKAAALAIVVICANPVSESWGQESDPLGVRWQETEGGGFWSAVWTRRGSSNTFDASWNGGRITAVMMISRVGDQVTVARRESSDGNDCDYTGVVSGASVSGTYTCKSGGPYEWTATIEQGFAGNGPGTVDQATIAKCSAQQDAQDELVLRARASQTSLAVLLTLRTAIDQAYEANRELFYADATIDIATLASGWPLGKAATQAFLGETKNTFTEKLLKAGLKSIEKKLLKDASLGDVFNHVTKSAAELEGLEFDLTKEAMKNSLKEVLGEQSAMSVFVVYDLSAFGYKRYKGMKALDAYRQKARDVDTEILAVERSYNERKLYAEAASRAVEQCLYRVGLQLEPDSAEYNWQEVQAYMATR